MRPWFERDPALLDRELAAFAAAGITAIVDEAARAAGMLRIELEFPAGDAAVRLVAVYPDFFPFFRPEVAAPELELSRHQTPNGGNLCLIGRRSSNWFAEDTLATVLVEQMPHLLEFAQSGDLAKLADVEEHQGEPASVYYNWEAVPDSCVLVDSGWNLKGTASGTFRIRCERLVEPSSLRSYVRGFVDRVTDAAGLELASWTGPQPEEASVSLTGSWSRLPQAIPGSIHDVRACLGEEEWARLSAPEPGNYKRHVTVAALVFPDEIGHQLYADGWGFIQFDHPRAHRGQPRGVHGYFLRSARAGASDLAARSAAAATFTNAVVVVVGLGAIGAPVAVELARCGAKELRLVDGDTMEPSTARRWPIGWPAFARAKGRVLAERIHSDYPWTEVVTCGEMIGRAAEPGVRRQGEMIEELINGADLVIDATAEMGVSHFLSSLCELRGMPLVIANATPGGWGGMVVRFAPGSPCWMCFRTALYGPEPQLPLPPADDSNAGEVQPAGCAEPTFSGASFDLQEVSLEAVRASASMLGLQGGYPIGAWQYACLSLRDDGERRPPVWTVHPIPRRPECSCAVP